MVNKGIYIGNCDVALPGKGFYDLSQPSPSATSPQLSKAQAK